MPTHQERITIAAVTRANWRATLALGVAPDQQRFVAEYAPIAALALAKAYIRPGDLVWAPYAFFAHESAQADANGVMVGFAALAYEPESIGAYWLFHFFIDERYQGRGYGRLALERLIAVTLAAHPRCRAIQLTVHPENVRAQRFYTHAGFHPTGDLVDGEPHFRLEW